MKEWDRHINFEKELKYVKNNAYTYSTDL